VGTTRDLRESTGPKFYSTQLNFTCHALKTVVDNVYMTATP
jgi:hypothetical protein